MGYLTTHVLDTVRGEPGAGIKIDLYSIDPEPRLLKSVTTNSDGRCDQPLLAGEEFKIGRWELVFHVQDYFTRVGVAQKEPPFLDQVVLRFGIAAEDQHYHVPLLVTPWSYSTYRGS